MLKKIILIFLFVHSFNFTYAQNGYAMAWLGFIKGDVNNAKLLNEFPDTSKYSDFCVIFDDKLFDPCNQRSIDIVSSRPIFFKKLFLLLSFPRRDTCRSYCLSIIVDKTIPLCTQCDGGCYKVKNSQIDTIIINIELEAGNRIRRFFDVSNYISDWHLIDINFTAILKEHNHFIKKSSAGASKWPWCM